MKTVVPVKIAGILLSVILTLLLVTSPLFAQTHPYNVISGSQDGELKSKGSDYGQYIQGDKSYNRGALGGGTRGYEWITTSKSPGKRGALGAIDGEPDIGGSSKGNTFTTTTLQDTIRIGQTLSGNYEIFKGFLSFDTSGIPYDATIQSATLTIYGKTKNISGGGVDFDIQVYNSEYTEPLWNPDWGAVSAGTTLLRGSLNTTSFVEDQKNVITITNATHANHLIESGGITRISLVSSRTVASQPPSGDEYVEIYSANASDPNKRPKLDIQYDGDAPNIKPMLTWTGEQYYKMNGVYPEEVWVGENELTFRIQYTHILGTAPLVKQVWIDLNSDGDFTDAGEKVDLLEVDPLDTDYTNGKDYYRTVTLNSDGISDIRYRFVFTDENSVEATGLPTQVASLATLQAEEKNVCFISTVEKPNSFASFESVINYFEERPLISSILSVIVKQELVVKIPF